MSSGREPKVNRNKKRDRNEKLPRDRSEVKRPQPVDAGVTASDSELVHWPVELIQSS